MKPDTLAMLRALAITGRLYIDCEAGSSGQDMWSVWCQDTTYYATGFDLEGCIADCYAQLTSTSVNW